jgi:hypothetical protein
VFPPKPWRRRTKLVLKPASAAPSRAQEKTAELWGPAVEVK